MNQTVSIYLFNELDKYNYATQKDPDSVGLRILQVHKWVKSVALPFKKRLKELRFRS